MFAFLASTLSIPTGFDQAFSQLPLLGHLTTIKPATCNCTGTNNTGPPGKPFICRDPRLGPRLLPKRFPLLSFVSNYDRFGGLPPAAFLTRWTDPETGLYRYPPANGFQLSTSGDPILANMTLLPGTKVDRFGSEYGKFISAADAPYSQRALPPTNLNGPREGDFPYGYHVYEVKERITVEGGPIAPWFGQPGLGAQFYIGATGNILELLSKGLLERVNLSEIDAGEGPGSKAGCGL